MIETSMTKDIMPLINALCADEYNDLLKTMMANQDAVNEAADALVKIIFRERALSANLVKYGKTKNGSQRYLDKETAKTSSISSKSIVKYTKKTYKQWSDYIRCMLYGLSLRQIAIEVGISKTTAFNWRHKIIKAMAEYEAESQLSGDIQIDETYFLLNLKGPWHNKSMPRRPKKRGRAGVQRGLSNEQVCVLIAIDETDQVLTKIIGQGNPLAEDIYESLDTKIVNHSRITTDSKSAYKEVSKNLACELHQIPSGKHKLGDYNLGVMNQYHSELKSWFKRFKGVSTKHLEGYLMWFRFMKSLNYKLEFNQQEKFMLQYAISTETMIKNKDISEKPFPVDIFKPYQHLC
ncbi:MAG: IS1595 family transposase [Tenericutes bacterium]|jgi:transposase-like protein|nr:IS1595 family transposase [Mycoplasmatota bacterium]